MSMIEKAALAALKARYGEQAKHNRFHVALAKQEVRAVIEELMKATPEMVEAGTQAYAFRTYQSFTTEDEAARDILRAALTAALNEGEGA